MNNPREDSVFHVSLTEIAFTLILLLVMLLGIRLYSVGHEVKTQAAELKAKNEQIDRYQNEIRQLVAKELGGLCKPDPEDPIESMMPCNKCVSVVAKIPKNEAANAIALGRKLLDQWKSLSNEDYKNFEKTVIETAEKLARGEKFINVKEADKAVAEFAAAKEELNKVKEENASLQESIKDRDDQLVTIGNQNKYLQRAKGLGYPPCWPDENGKPQYILTVTVLPDDQVIAVPAWPKQREEEALEMDGIKGLMPNFGTPIPMSVFEANAQDILRRSNNAKPAACRHFVVFQNEIPDSKTAIAQRHRVENFFYKYESRK
jgi:hypothetical protein